jgi:hypothetical protein
MIDTGIVKTIITEPDRLLLFVEKRSYRIIAPKNWNGKVGDVIEFEFRGPMWAMLIQKPVKLWIVIYHHRFGTDGFPVWQNEEPDLDDCARNELEDFEFDTDEYLELSGPFDIPSF